MFVQAILCLIFNPINLCSRLVLKESSGPPRYSRTLAAVVTRISRQYLLVQQSYVKTLWQLYSLLISMAPCDVFQLKKRSVLRAVSLYCPFCAPPRFFFVVDVAYAADIADALFSSLSNKIFDFKDPLDPLQPLKPPIAFYGSYTPDIETERMFAQRSQVIITFVFFYLFPLLTVGVPLVALPLCTRDRLPTFCRPPPEFLVLQCCLGSA